MDEERILYHGTSSWRAERIQAEGFRPRAARHETYLLRTILRERLQFEASEDTRRGVRDIADNRLGLNHALGRMISFVDDFGLARIWTLEQSSFSELDYCLKEAYEKILDMVPESPKNEAFRRHVSIALATVVHRNASGSVVVTASVPASWLHTGTMRFQVPLDGSYLRTIREYISLGSETLRQAERDYFANLGLDRLEMDFSEERRVMERFDKEYRHPFRFSIEQVVRRNIPAERVLAVTEVS